MLSLLLAVPSCIYSFWHGVIPTSYFIFNDFYILVSLIFYPGLALTVTVTGSEMVSRATRIYTYRRTRTRMRIVPEVVTFTC